jgi:hypothetical protein
MQFFNRKKKSIKITDTLLRELQSMYKLPEKTFKIVSALNGESYYKEKDLVMKLQAVFSKEESNILLKKILHASKEIHATGANDQIYPLW